MNLFNSILSFTGYLFHLSSTTLIHSGQYLKFQANLKITDFFNLVVNLGFFLVDIFVWLFTKINALRNSNYFFKETLKKRNFVQKVHGLCFRFIHRKKHRKPIRLSKVMFSLNYFRDYLVISSRLNKVFAPITIFIVYITLLYSVFRFLNYRLKQETFNYLKTKNIEVKVMVHVRDIYYKFVKLLNTLYIIKVFCINKRIHKSVIKVFNKLFKFVYIFN